MARRNQRFGRPGSGLGWKLRAFGLALVALIGTWRWMATQSGDEVSGTARIIDGDSLVVGGREIRMIGIDAPEGRQSCTRQGQTWRCGDAARDALRRLSSGGVRCKGEGNDQHNRLLAVCFSGGRDINAALVAEGAAVSYGRYKAEEAAARRDRRGLWAGEFEMPKDWRHRNLPHR